MNPVILVLKRIGIVALLSSLSWSVLAFDGHHEGRLIKALDLTPAQQEQFKSLRQINKQERHDHHEAFKAITEKKQALLADYDEAQAQSIANEEAALHKARILRQMARQQAIYAMLNDEQKETFKALLTKEPRGKKDKHRKMDNMHKPACKNEA